MVHKKEGVLCIQRRGSLCTSPELQLGLGLELRVLLSHVRVLARLGAAGAMGGETSSADADTVYM